MAQYIRVKEDSKLYGQKGTTYLAGLLQKLPEKHQDKFEEVKQKSIYELLEEADAIAAQARPRRVKMPIQGQGEVEEIRPEPNRNGFIPFQRNPNEFERFRNQWNAFFGDEAVNEINNPNAVEPIEVAEEDFEVDDIWWDEDDIDEEEDED